MASCFQAQWLQVSITPIRKHRDGAPVGSGRSSIFASNRGLKPRSSLKLRRETSNGYSFVAAKSWRIYCRDFQDGYEYGGQESAWRNKTEAEKVVEKFFNSINNRNVSQLTALLSDDCCYEDALFDSPFMGKKDVSRFVARLMDAMGPNVKFEARVFCLLGSDEAAAQWILKWKGKEIPFTLGFNWFLLDEKQLLISKIGSLNEELRVKPGERILKVLKIISTTLDESQNDMEAISISLPKIYRIMKEDRSLADIAELVAEPFKLNNEGSSLT
ncbi:uncharacterized protein LOC110028263 [Phalaenopsis equestris]|uniref:uncharacterized protein LOC110028263 n=1 Tax=Phalaenopsis equestris TaxID=78828 RepID=UPI0009E51181|nr:uncharacterized protein LOC110028263 [Phalaenopsis equestris]